MSNRTHIKYLKELEKERNSKFLRINIINYELGNFIRCIVYANRFNKQRGAYLADAKLELSDLITQMRLFYYEKLGTDISKSEIEEMGARSIGDRAETLELCSELVTVAGELNDINTSNLHSTEVYTLVFDAINLIHQLCRELGVNYFELEALGEQHARERYVDFENNEWSSVRG